jgi:hypothetical protein
MIILFGLVILIAAVVVGVAGVLANGGGAHPLTDHFAVFGYHVTGSTGLLFLYGIVVGALGLFGLSLLLAGARRTARRGRTARRELTQSRRETAAANQDRRDLADAQQHQTADADADADAKGTTVRGPTPDDANRVERGNRGRGRLGVLNRRPADQQPISAGGDSGNQPPQRP